MPELADVEGFRRVAARAVGHRIEHVKVVDSGVLRNRTAAQFRRTFHHRAFASAERYGKWLVISTGGPVLAVSFGMTGSLHWMSHRTPLAHDDRVVFETDAGDLRYRDLRKLRGLFVVKSPDHLDQVIGHLGPDALTIDANDLRLRLGGKRSPIKTLLMDQASVAGIGNMLSDEILWRSHIDPRTPGNQLTSGNWTALHRGLRSVLHAAVRAGHTPRGPRWLSSVRWTEGLPCPACGTTLQRHRVGGRTAVSCPRCQPRRPLDSNTR